MSIEAVSAVLPIQGLPPAEKLCLIGIANHAGDGGAWPAVATLAMYVGVSSRQCQRLIAKLVERGLVSVDVNAGGSAKTRKDQRPNLYHLHLDGVTPMTPRGVTPSAERGDTAMSPEPSLNHPQEEDPANPSASRPESLEQKLARERYDAGTCNQNFLAIRGVVKKALANGWSEDDLRAALKEIPVVSGGALDLWRSKHPLPKQREWNHRDAVPFHWFCESGEREGWLQCNEHAQVEWMTDLHASGATDTQIGCRLIVACKRDLGIA